jgi:hypothetical protein
MRIWPQCLGFSEEAAILPFPFGLHVAIEESRTST